MAYYTPLKPDSREGGRKQSADGTPEIFAWTMPGWWPPKVRGVQKDDGTVQNINNGSITEQNNSAADLLDPVHDTVEQNSLVSSETEQIDCADGTQQLDPVENIVTVGVKSTSNTGTTTESCYTVTVSTNTCFIGDNASTQQKCLLLMLRHRRVYCMIM